MWATNGIVFIKDMLGNNNFMGKLIIKCNFPDILQIRQSIPPTRRDLLYNLSKQESSSFTLTTKVIYVLVAKTCRDPACIAKWNKDYLGFRACIMSYG